MERELPATRGVRARVLSAVAIVFLLAIFAGACGKKESSSQKDARTGDAAEVDPSAPGVVLDMIDAHGGMAAWRAARTVSFEDEFGTPGGGPTVVSRVMVDQRRRRAYIDFPGTDMSLGWDGTQAWSTHWTEPYPPRFLALLDYYFLDLPWLTMDPGVRLATAGEDSLWSDPTRYSVVKMSFAPGTGDTPGDTYRLYIDPATKRLKACAYTATYRAMVPDSMNSMPEHVLVFEEHTTVGGLVVPTRYTIYRADHTPVATCLIRDWSFERPFDESRMTLPAGAVVDESRP